MRKRSNCSAFTLTELLAVIGIIAILAGLLLPVSMRALDKARSAKCAANMSSIYRAYQMRIADEAKNYRWIPIRTAGWAGILLAYVDGKEKIFRCPVDRTGHWGGVNTMFAAQCVGNCVEMPGTMQLDSGRSFGASTTDYHGWLPPVNISGLPADSQYQLLAGYVGNPGSASWEVRVCSGSGAAVNGYTAFGGSHGYGFTILRDTKRLRIDTASKAVPLLDGKGAMLINGTNIVALVGQEVSVGMVTYCSYGMNDYDIQGTANWSGGGVWMQVTYAYFWPKVPANKILLMDYTNTQIAAHTMASNSVTWSATDRARLKRHTSLSKANVLFGDGTVQLMDPAEIDPGTAGKYAKYWEPEQP